MTDTANRSLLGLSTLVQLEKRVRHVATPAELTFLMVNETHALTRYRQAVLWRATGKRRGKVTALSGLATVAKDAPFVVWLSRLLTACDRAGETTPRRLTSTEASSLDRKAGEEWPTWLPAHGLWLPLVAGRGQRLGALLLARDEPWNDAELHLLSYLADAYGHAWAGLLGKRAKAPSPWGRRVIPTLVVAALIGACFLPVTQSVLAPAEVIAEKPAIVRSPIDGIVDRFLVAPNQPVTIDEILLALDPTRLDNRLTVAREALKIAEAEYRQAAQQAFFDERAKASLAVLQGRVDQHAAEVDYLTELTDRLQIKAPRTGIAIFDSADDWIGRPVKIGERILMVANPTSMELEIRLPVSDAIVLEPGAQILFFLNVDPLAPVSATLKTAGYQASAGPDGVMAYRLTATFDRPDGPLPSSLRIGLKGTAKLYGADTTLFYYVMRRPLAVMRQWLGL